MEDQDNEEEGGEDQDNEEEGGEDQDIEEEEEEEGKKRGGEWAGRMGRFKDGYTGCMDKGGQ